MAEDDGAWVDRAVHYHARGASWAAEGGGGMRSPPPPGWPGLVDTGARASLQADGAGRLATLDVDAVPAIAWQLEEELRHVM
jgi:hypothetical protein